MNCVHFQLAMLAYNLNCWRMLFNRDEQATAVDLKHTTLATARRRNRLHCRTRLHRMVKRSAKFYPYSRMLSRQAS